MAFFDRDGLRFHYRDEGEGVPVFFQHGLGADVNQPFGLFAPPAGVRLLAFDARGHGATRPLGDPKKIAFDEFADDLIALMDHLGLARAVVGGIALGAAVALHAALRYPERVIGLILSRPAWLDRPLPENVRVFTHIAQHIEKYGAREGLEHFRESPEYRAVLRESIERALALENQFLDPRAEECVARLERLPHDAPSHDRGEWAQIRVPTLVLGNRQDPLHPWEHAETLARAIPRAELRELTPKAANAERHAAEVQEALAGFLTRRFLNKTNGAH